MAERHRVTYTNPDGTATFLKPKKLLTKKQAKKAYEGLVKRLTENKKRHMVEGWGEWKEQKNVVYCPRCGAPLKRGAPLNAKANVWAWVCWHCGWRTSGDDNEAEKPEQWEYVQVPKEEKPLWRGWAFKKIGEVPMLSKKTPVADISRWSKVKMVKEED